METDAIHLFYNAGFLKLKYRLFNVLILALGIFFACSYGSVFADSNNHSYADIERSLKEKRNKFSVLLSEIGERITTLKKIESLNSQQQSELLSLSQIDDFLHKSVESASRAIHFVESSQKVSQQLKFLQKKLESPLQEEELKSGIIDSKLTLEQLELQFEAAIKMLTDAKNVRNEVQQEINRRNERSPKIEEEIKSIRTRLEELQRSTATATNSKDRPVVTKKSLRDVEIDYLSLLIQELELEDRSYNQQRELLRMQRYAAERDVLVAERNFNNYEEIINQRRSAVAERTKQVAATASEAANSAHPLVRTIMEENKQLAAELTSITAKSVHLSKRLKQQDNLSVIVQRNYDRIQEKIIQTGLTNVIGLKLRNDLKLLPDIENYERKIDALALEIHNVQQRRIEIEDRLLEMVDVNSAVSRMISDAKIELQEPARSELHAAVYQALEQQKEDYLNGLISVYDDYFDTKLYVVYEKELEFIALIKEYKAFIDTHILWVQSAPMIQFKDVRGLGAATAWLFNPSSWIEVTFLLGADIKDNFVVITPLFLSFLVLLLIQRLLKQKLSVLGRYVTKLSKASFVDTLWAVVITILLSLAWPLFIYLITWRIQQIESDSEFVFAVSNGLAMMTYLLFSGLLLLNLCRENGLGELHFRWKRENMELVRKQLTWYLIVILPVIFIYVMTDETSIEAHHESMGRLVFFVFVSATTVLIYRLLHPAKGLLRSYLEKNSEGWASRLAGVWFPFLLITPFVLAVTSAAGYMYTAGKLSLLIIHSLLLVFAMIVGWALLIRWLNIEQRKLALEQWRKKFAAQDDDKSKAPEAGNQSVIEEAELDVEAISAQTMKLLNTAYWFTIVIGFALIWAQVFPAFNLLDEVVLWNTEVAGTEGGSNETTSFIPITLASLLLAVVIFIMTFFISNNIPGLLEIVILQRLPFTPSGRYAITSIVRYVIIIIGFAMTFSALGIGWSKVQWLAAAVTVGLGFGLQEIFANFVSGIVILFERPVRVGDVVTLGTISGKVSRIQMRATTITDWDRKELIIPNKEFVTGQVINWSLSDSILRIVISVGIAYGSDTKLAYDILMSIARNNPDVLKDPEPSAHFITFGDSSLHFELRIYIPDPDLFLKTRHELLLEIDRRFREAKIEIAFPQREIHIKNLSEQIAMAPKSIYSDLSTDEQAAKA